MKKIARYIILILLCFSLLTLSVLLYAKYLYPTADYEQIMNTLQNLTPKIINDSLSAKDYILGLLLFVLALPLIYWKTALKHQVLLLILSIFLTAHLSGFLTHIYYQHQNTTIYEEQYVAPKDLEITFPTPKRNLILIFLESFEQNYALAEYYGQNLIPHLSSIQTPTNHSPHHQALPSTNYSIASLASVHCGIPLRYNPKSNVWYTHHFLPNAVCFPEILKEHGYQTEIIKAADIKFTHADIFAKSHGYQKVYGVDELKQKYPELNEAQYQGTFGGISDSAMFDTAKKELRQLSANAPFLLTLFSLDTHGTDYHLKNTCQHKYNDLRDAYICTDTTVADFLEWLKKEPFADNTSVVIIGDHLSSIRLEVKKSPYHGIYNVFLNLPEGLSISPDKYFASFDLTPTILEAMDIKLSPRAFGLGRSLFSNEKTLTESMGTNLKPQLAAHSDFYDYLTTPPQHISRYAPYNIGTVLNSHDCLQYTDIYEETMGTTYLDELNFKLTATPKTDLTVTVKFKAITKPNGKITITANQKGIIEYPLALKQTTPHILKFNINKDLIKEDNHLQLAFHNNKGGISATSLGIALLEIKIENSEEKQ